MAAKADYRKVNFVIAGTTHIGPFLTADNHVVLAQINDGLTARSPGMSPDKARQIGQMLIDAADQAAELARTQTTPHAAKAA